MQQDTLPTWFTAIEHLTRFNEIDEVLRSRDFVQGTHREAPMFLGDTLMLIDGDAHFERRRMESPLFSRAALAYYERHALQPVITSTISDARANAGDDGVVRADLVTLTRTMLWRIAAVTTGMDGVEGSAATERFIHQVNAIGEAATVQWSTRPQDEVLAEGLAVRGALVEEFFEPSLQRRRDLVDAHRGGTVPLDELPRDLITSMLMSPDETWDDDLMLREATLYLIAATRTTLHAVPHALTHLREWMAEHPEDVGLASDPTFLRNVAGEALRLHPPSPALVRQAVNDVTLSSGRRIAAGERVALLFKPANRDADVFGADAELFDPHRQNSAAKSWGLSFGGGEHLCIGRSLVVGLGGRNEDGSDSTDGTVVAILRALASAGARPDPEATPQMLTTSLYDAYATYPILLD